MVNVGYNARKWLRFMRESVIELAKRPKLMNAVKNFTCATLIKLPPLREARKADEAAS